MQAATVQQILVDEVFISWPRMPASIAVLPVHLDGLFGPRTLLIFLEARPGVTDPNRFHSNAVSKSPRGLVSD
jgi:hypothetical protein